MVRRCGSSDVAPIAMARRRSTASAATASPLTTSSPAILLDENDDVGERKTVIGLCKALHRRASAVLLSAIDVPAEKEAEAAQSVNAILALIALGFAFLAVGIVGRLFLATKPVTPPIASPIAGWPPPLPPPRIKLFGLF